MEVRCRNCGELNPERAKFCLECGAPMTAAAIPASRESRRTVTVVFADMVGFTTLGERLDGESLRRVMDSFYAEMRAAIEAESGTLAKFIGDAVLAVWGTPEVHEDDAARAVRAAERMRRRLDGLNAELDRRWGVRIGLRTGVNTGEVVVDPGRPADLLVGDTLNVAARLEQAAGDGEILVGPGTWPLVRDGATLAPVEPLALKGKAEPMPAWRVIDGTLPDRRAAGRLQAPLVGREPQLARLRDALAATVAERACRLVTVIGSPGLGKTRLVAEFVGGIEEDAAILVGRCLDTGEGVTFGPIAEVLRAVARIEDDDAPDRARALLAEAVPAGEPDADRIVERAASVLGLAPPGSAEETFWAVRRVLELVARERPVVLVLDDVHWGQPTFFELIEHLVRWARTAPILVVAVARPELRERRPSLADPDRTEVIALDPLSVDGARAMIAGLLGGSTQLPASFADRVLEATGGNPLFLGELVRMLADDGLLRRENGGWALTGEAGDVAVPPTIQALLSARIERLGEEERTVVERAAVIGHEFYRGAVAELVPPPLAPALDDTLVALGRKELVRPADALWLDERVYRFHHVLVRDAAYRSLLKQARAELHERFADWLERKAGDLAGEHEEVIAFHLEQAHVHRLDLGPLDEAGRALGARAGARLASAGRRALRREDLPAAANLLERALVPLPADDPQRAEALATLAETLLAAGEAARALRVIEELGTRAEAEDDERLGAWATVLVAEHDALTGESGLAEVVEAGTEAAAVLEAAGDEAGIAKAWQVVAGAEGQRGRVAAAEAALDRALVAARAVGDDRRETAALAGAPRAALWGPAPILRAAGRCMDTIRVLRLRPGRRHVEAAALRCQAVLEAMRGRDGAAREILAGCRAVYEELGLARRLFETAVHAGIVELLAGEPARAEGEFVAARDGFDALGAEAPAALASALLARALLEQDRSDEAVDAAVYAEAHAGEDLKATVTALGARAEALARRGEHAAAREYAERAIALTAPTDALPDKADALMAAARVAEAGGDAAAATAGAREALRLYEAKGHTVGATAAAAFLEVAAPQAQTAGGPASDTATELAGTAVGRLLLEFVAAYNARDWARVAELNDPGLRSVDHRTLAWESIAGPDGWTTTLQAFVAASPDSRLSIDRVVELREDAGAVLIGGRGTTADGGAVEIVIGQVIAQRDGRTVTIELFEPDDEAAMRTRLAALLADPGDIETWLASTQIGRAYLRYSAASRGGDLEAFRDVYTDDFVMRDGRAVGWVETRGREEMLELLASFQALSSWPRSEVVRILRLEDDLAAVILRSRADTGQTGEVELVHGQVARARDERIAAIDLFEPEDEAGMLARFDELRATDEIDARMAATAIGRNYLDGLGRFRDADWDGLRAVFAEEIDVVDHRNVGWDLDRGVDPLVGLLRGLKELVPDAVQRVVRILALDDDLAALELKGTGTLPDGGPAELNLGQVSRLRDGRRDVLEIFEPDDHDGMLARLAELRAEPGLGATAIGRAYEDFLAAFRDRDWDRLADGYAPGFVMRDLRTLGWGDTREGRGVADLLADFVALAPDATLEIERVIACEEDRAALVLRGRGTREGGPVELRFGHASRADGGRFGVLELLDPDDEARIRARYAELEGEAAAAARRTLADWTEACDARDWERLRALYADRPRFVDRRAMGWETTDRVEQIVTATSGFEAGVRFEPEVLGVATADDGDCAVAIRARFSKSGEWELLVGMVVLVGDGRITGGEYLDPDDAGAIVARARALVPGPEARARRFVGAWVDALNRRDWEALRPFYGEDARVLDRRAMAWAVMDGVDEIMGGLQATDPGTRVDAELLAVVPIDDDSWSAAVVHHYAGDIEGGGGWQLDVGMAAVVRDGLIGPAEVFDADDREAILARAGELAEGPQTRARRAVAEWAEAFRARDWGRMRSFYDERAEVVDRRALGWTVMGGVEEILEGLRSNDPETHFEAEVLEVVPEPGGEWAVALLHRYTGRAEGGGEFRFDVGAVSYRRDGRIQRVEIFDAENPAAIVARARELAAAGSGELREMIDRYTAAINGRDWEALQGLFAPDAVFLDHRTVGRGERDLDRLIADAQGATAMTPDLRVEVRVLWQGRGADGDLVSAGVEHLTGTTADGGSFVVAIGSVIAVRDGVVVGAEHLAPEDEAAIVARARELAGQ